MALHDTDKQNDGRSQPKLNERDVMLDWPAHNSSSPTYRKDSNNNYQRIAFKNAIILFYDDQNRIIRVDGFIPQLANYPVTIIANYGYDVYTDILGLTPPGV